MALGRFDRALHHRKIGDARRRQTLRARDQHGDVEMIRQQLAGFDGAFVAAIDQRDAFAVEADIGNFGQRLGRNREQRRHLRPGRGGVRRPAGGFAHVDEGDRAGSLAGDFGEQRRLLGAADGDRRRRLRQRRGTARSRRGRAGCGLHLRAAAAARNRVGVERHGVLAGTHQDGAFFRHFSSGLVPPAIPRSPRHALGYNDPNLKVPSGAACRPEHA